LLLLDLKLPWMDGFDVLSWLRRQREFETLPVVILTSSRLQADIDQSKLMGVYDYRVKPQDIEELVNLLTDIRKRWLEKQFENCRGLLGIPESQAEDGFSSL
jgi:DNA-binding response OmpR family regulator